ncbi:MAG: response regulator transcription factor [Anaerolineales bacterium]|nr:response regulator transcription factor [Anaerolineales bacterium]
MSPFYFTPRILVVDDDLDTLGLLRMVFKRAGYETITATCWEEVTDRVATAQREFRNFDLIILDIMMPDRSGFDIFRSLKVALDTMPPVIFLSAKYATEDMITASDLGAVKYLVKPTTPEKLLDAVNSVLSHTR